MTYLSQHDLAINTIFQSRVTMCVAEQAEIFINDERPEFSGLAKQAIAALEPTARQFVALTAVRPGMSVDSTDGDILAAVQYVWPIIGAPYIPVEPPIIGATPA